jgi:hypothetical protein
MKDAVLKIKQHELKLKDLEQIKETNETIFVPESDYGLAEIYFRDGHYELFAIPMYGGEPYLEMSDSNAQTILDTVKNWY